MLRIGDGLGGGRMLGLLVCLAGKKITRKKKMETESGKLMGSGGKVQKPITEKRKVGFLKG